MLVPLNTTNDAARTRYDVPYARGVSLAKCWHEKLVETLTDVVGMT